MLCYACASTLAMSLRLLLPVLVSLCLGVLLYLYWRESDELEKSRLAYKQLQKELTASRGERDQLQFRLNLVREDLDSSQLGQEESEKHAQELDEQLQEEQGKLVSMKKLAERSNNALLAL